MASGNTALDPFIFYLRSRLGTESGFDRNHTDDKTEYYEVMDVK